MSIMDELSQILALDPIEVNLFRGGSPPEERQRIFGGQVVAQALVAAYRTVEGRICHSLQSYFIRPGDPAVPVLYQVERSRDGKSFATRRVIAIQHGEQIFNMACSFQVPEDGLDHQNEMPDVPRPETLQDDFDRVAGELQALPERARGWHRRRPIELRQANPVSLLNPKPAPAEQY